MSTRLEAMSSEELRKILNKLVKEFINALENDATLNYLLRLRNIIRGVLLTLEEKEKQTERASGEFVPREIHISSENSDSKNTQSSRLRS